MERENLAELSAFVRDSLLHYARWMVENETFYLDEPENLEYPTETWAAQELRKGTTLWMAARIADPEEKKLFEAKGIEILERSWTSLSDFGSRHFTRPVALVLQQGYLEAGLVTGLSIPDSESLTRETGGRGALEPPVPFSGQRQQFRKLLRSPWKWPTALPHVVRPTRWLNLATRSWGVERLRHWIESKGWD